MHDKFKTCMDCPDRTITCHATCEGYRKRSEENAKLRDERNKRNRLEHSLNAYEYERSCRIKSKVRKKKSRGFSENRKSRP